VRAKTSIYSAARIFQLLHTQGFSLTGYDRDEDRDFLIPTDTIVCVESLDLQTLISTEKATYQSRLRPDEADEVLCGNGFLNLNIDKMLDQSNFVRISKRAIINILKIKDISPAGNGTFQMLLYGEGKLIISPQYVPALIAKLIARMSEIGITLKLSATA